MTIAGRDFQPPLWATLATLAGVALTIVLGFWQLGRANFKQDLQGRLDAFAKQSPIAVGAQALDAETIALRRIEARGTFDPRHVVFIDNRIYKHQPGYYVMMPLRSVGRTGIFWLTAAGSLPVANSNTAPQRSKPQRARLWCAALRYRRVNGSSRTLQQGRRRQHLAKYGAGALPPGDASGWHNIILQQTETTATTDDDLVRDWPPLT